MLEACALGKKEDGQNPPEEQRIVEGQRDDTGNTEGMTVKCRPTQRNDH